MKSLEEVHSGISELNDVDDMYYHLYESRFGDMFNRVQDMYHEMKSESENDIHHISDEDLQWIITELPLDLFNISESLNKMILESQVMKLKIKELKSSKDTEDQIMELTMIQSIYSSVISRVQNEISFSKELIMGAKKIWDSRVSSEKSNPIGEVTDLPEYNRKEYIK